MEHFMLRRMESMQKILIIISLLLYWVGCGSSNGKSIPSNTLQTLSDDTTIKATRVPDHISIMEIAALELEGVALDIVISDDGNIAYIASGDAGVNVVDISDPYNPTLIALYPTSQYANYVSLTDNILSVYYKPQNWNDYLFVSVYDVSDPHHATQLTMINENGNHEHKNASIDGLHYYVDHEGFKVAVEMNYKVIGRYDLFDTAYAFGYRNEYFFIANGRNGLTVLKVGDGNYKAVLDN